MKSTRRLNVAEKIISKHLVSGNLVNGSEIGLKIDQTITQDATGTMACLQFEALGIPRVATLAVSYVDHNMLQTGFENADDHRYLRTMASKYGIKFSKPGNGICHQVHLERFAVPGATLLGSDSHTPTAGGIGSIAIGAGGLDIAVAMGSAPFYLKMPEIVGVELSGSLKPWVSAKDVILELLRRLTVKGGVGKIFEYFGPGVSNLSVPERATITNMGAELGATTSIFPSDSMTLAFMKSQGREDSWQEIIADNGSTYAEIIKIDLSGLVPLIARPSSPDSVVPVSDLEGTRVEQVCLGSCTNSSLKDLTLASELLKGKKVASHVSMSVSPGSSQVLSMIASSGALASFISAGARILESGCGPCIGMGQSPPTGAVSLRTFNRNFPGRSGTKDDKVYLCSPEVAVAAAIHGQIVNPSVLGEYPSVCLPDSVIIDDSRILDPSPEPESVEVVRGPNIAELPVAEPLSESISAEVLLKVQDNITTDHIMPAGAKVLPLRSNIPKISEFVYSSVDPDFASRAKEKGIGIIIGGSNYGQGSSREHAALAPMYLGIKAVIAKSFARIHKANLINFGILPLTFDNPADYDAVAQGCLVELKNIRDSLAAGNKIKAKIGDKNIILVHDLSERQLAVVLEGGLLNYTKEQYKRG